MVRHEEDSGVGPVNQKLLDAIIALSIKIAALELRIHDLEKKK